MLRSHVCDFPLSLKLPVTPGRSGLFCKGDFPHNTEVYESSSRIMWDKTDILLSVAGLLMSVSEQGALRLSKMLRVRCMRIERTI